MATLKAKVTTHDRPTSRPTSPFKAPTQPGAFVRPKAKVNTSATFGPRKLTVAASSITQGLTKPAASTSRPPSPFKSSQRIENQSLPTYQPIKARLNAPTISLSPRASPIGPHVSRSNPSSPNSKQRRASLTMHHSKSTVSLASRGAPPSSPLVPTKSPGDGNSNGAGPSSIRNPRTLSRVTSKLTRTPKSTSPIEPPVPSLPLNVPIRPTFTRSRVPSVSNISILSSSPSSISSLPASISSNATKHRRNFSQPKNESIYQPFHVDDDQTIRRSAYSGNNSNRVSPIAKVDPTLIPLPAPHSPPTSSVSFSSQSSLSSYDTQFSARSGSVVSALKKSHSSRLISPQGDSNSSRTTLIYNQPRDGSPSSGEEDTDDRRMKAEAKSIRKIADLEITNRSLMVINGTLEATKHRQAKEIRDLRRKLRESRLILPPKKFRQVKSSLDYDDTADEDDDNYDDENDDDEDETGDPDFKDDQDQGFKRVRTMLEVLLDQARKALATKPDDFECGPKGTTKVLHAEELRSWRNSDEEGNSQAPSIIHGRNGDSDDSASFTERQHDRLEADTSLQDSDHDSEEEVEGIISIRVTPS